jgi:hypothetical protein
MFFTANARGKASDFPSRFEKIKIFVKTKMLGRESLNPLVDSVVSEETWRPLQPRILTHGSFSFNATDASLFTFYEAYNLVDVLKNWALIVNSATAVSGEMMRDNVNSFDV